MSQSNSGDIASQADEPGAESDRPTDDEHPLPSTTSVPEHGGNFRGQPLPTTISLNLQATDCNPPAQDWLVIQLTKLAELADIKPLQLSIAIVDDDQMSELHEQYMDITGTTDVLTFDLSDDPTDPSNIEGELVLCIDEAARQATSRGHQTRDELLLYGLHGLLHLMGYDDHDDDDYKKMHQREDQLLTQAGFSALFASEIK